MGERINKVVNVSWIHFSDPSLSSHALSPWHGPFIFLQMLCYNSNSKCLGLAVFTWSLIQTAFENSSLFVALKCGGTLLQFYGFKSIQLHFSLLIWARQNFVAYTLCHQTAMYEAIGGSLSSCIKHKTSYLYTEITTSGWLLTILPQRFFSYCKDTKHMGSGGFNNKVTSQIRNKSQGNRLAAVSTGVRLVTRNPPGLLPT